MDPCGPGHLVTRNISRKGSYLVRHQYTCRFGFPVLAGPVPLPAPLPAPWAALWGVGLLSSRDCLLFFAPEPVRTTGEDDGPGRGTRGSHWLEPGCGRSVIIAVELLRGVSFSFLAELREVLGEAGGEDVAVPVEDPGGESVGGSSVTVVTGDNC
jgi:hypothetical protein